MRSGPRTTRPLLAAALTLPLCAHALSVEVTATDLADLVAGQDLWRYSYQLSDATFAPDEGFTLGFSAGLYTALSNAGVANGDWDLLLVQPDPGGPYDGALDALALVDGASLGDPFTVDFVWTGVGTPPGLQPFDAYVCADPPACLSVDPHPAIAAGTTGGTTAPEPAPLALLGAGLAALGRLRARNR